MHKKVALRSKYIFLGFQAWNVWTLNITLYLCYCEKSCLFGKVLPQSDIRHITGCFFSDMYFLIKPVWVIFHDVFEKFSILCLCKLVLCLSMHTRVACAFNAVPEWHFHWQGLRIWQQEIKCSWTSVIYLFIHLLNYPSIYLFIYLFAERGTLKSQALIQNINPYIVSVISKVIWGTAFCSSRDCF